jgi:hypothetical protein
VLDFLVARICHIHALLLFILRIFFAQCALKLDRLFRLVFEDGRKTQLSNGSVDEVFPKLSALNLGQPKDRTRFFRLKALIIRRARHK